MGSVKVREAVAEDDAVIGELLVQAFTQTYAAKMPQVVVDEKRKEELRAVENKRARATVLVAEEAGRLVGTVALFPPGADGSEAWLPDAADLRHLAVDPALHGKNLSGLLMDAAEAVAVELSVRAICLHVRRGAHGVARLYLERGYLRDTSGDLEKPNVFLEGYVLHLPKP